jgi:hypothetical protein
MAFWIIHRRKATKEQVDDKLMAIKLFSYNYARDLLFMMHMWMLIQEKVLDLFLPKIANFTTNVNNGTKSIINIIQPDKIPPPIVPRFIILWGFIGSVDYILKVTTYYIGKKKFS